MEPIPVQLVSVQPEEPGARTQEDSFIEPGRGDRALVTCGLLRYRGWDGCVAAFFPAGGGDGHALCPVRRTDLPRGFDCYTVEPGALTLEGSPVRPGCCVPSGCGVVGGSSRAVKRGWILGDFYTPERICGRVMQG